MMTRVLPLALLLTLASCNQSDYAAKSYLDNPYQKPPTSGLDDGGVDGGSTGGTTDGSTTDGGSTDGSSTGGSTSGTTDGSSTGGSTGGSTTGTTTTGGSTDGSTTGGTTGSTTGDSTTGGSTTGSTTGGTTGTTDGSTTGGTTGSTTGDTTGGGTTGSTTGGTTGTSYQSMSETFHQAATVNHKLDIMWVIDNSGSMADKQTNLGAYFDHFIRGFITKGIDFKMGITTTDTSSSTKKGKMVTGSDTKLTSAMAAADENQFFTDFSTLVKVGTSGSGNEKGLEATEGFMQKYASTWMRPDAYLAVVILSDEEDQSPKTPKEYTDYLKSFKSEAGLVKVYSIVDSNLRNMQSNITKGYLRYAEASSNTAGVVGDIYEDFTSVLSTMGDSLVNLLDSFALANQPIDGSIHVFVDGTETTAFSYDAASRSIKFDRGFTPAVGATIRVDYLK